MLRHSFTVGSVDMRERFGLIAESFGDFLQPALRPRKVVTPFRDGAFDYGAEFYDEREFTVNCASPLLSRAECRDLSAVLANKAEIRRWDEPDKYYVGRAYDPADIERIAGQAKRFAITFICEPFAYGEQRTAIFDGRSELSYAGTARTPTRITITNNSESPMIGLTVIMREVVIL